MNWLAKLFSRGAAPKLRTKAAGGSNMLLFEGTTLQYPSWDMPAQIKEGLETNSVVYACVELITKTASSVRWCLFKKTGTDRNELETHPMLDKLARPNNLMGFPTFVKTTLGYLLVTGNGFVWANRVGKEPVELWPLRPDRFQIQPSGRLGQIDHYEYKVQGQTEVFKAEDTLHLKLFQTWANEWFGLSPVQVGALLIDTDNKSVNWNRGLLGNRGRPDSLFMFENALSEEQRRSFKEQLDTEYVGDASAGKPLVLENSIVKYQQLSSTPQEMDFIASTSMTNRRICQLFGVAPELIGDPQNKTYANQMEARIALVEQVVFPLLDHLRGELNNWLVPMYGDGLELDYDKDSVDVIAEKRNQVYQSLASADFLSINEKRVAAGFDEIDHPEADTPDRLLAMAQVPDMEEQPDEGEEPEEDDEDPEEKTLLPYECKFLNVDTEEKKLAFWNDMDRRRKAFEKPATRLMRKHFAGEKRRVVAAYKANGKKGASEAVAASKPALRVSLKKIYTQVGSYFFRQSAAAIGKLAKKDMSTALRGMRAYFSFEVDRKSTLIQQTTEKRLAKLLEDAIFGGKTDEQIVGQIEDFYDDQVETRAVTIAETESGNGANMGTVYGAKSADMPLVKVWISQRDERVRDHHKEADSKKVGLEDLFVVNGQQMEFPGDDSHGATADNIVNCRCYVAFEEAS